MNPSTSRLRLALAIGLAICCFSAPSSSAAPIPKERKTDIELANTVWIGKTYEGMEMTLIFRKDGTLISQYSGNTYTTATWKQDGNKVTYEMNNRYCEFEGTLDGKKIEGTCRNVQKLTWASPMVQVTNYTDEIKKLLDVKTPAVEPKQPLLPPAPPGLRQIK